MAIVSARGRDVSRFGLGLALRSDESVVVCGLWLVVGWWLFFGGRWFVVCGLLFVLGV